MLLLAPHFMQTILSQVIWATSLATRSPLQSGQAPGALTVDDMLVHPVLIAAAAIMANAATVQFLNTFISCVPSLVVICRLHYALCTVPNVCECSGVTR